MTGLRLEEHVEHFRSRVLQDALSEATADYWLRRAEAHEAARPRVGDFRGEATLEDLKARDMRCAATAEGCRQRARVALLGESVPNA